MSQFRKVSKKKFIHLSNSLTRLGAVGGGGRGRGEVEVGREVVDVDVLGALGPGEGDAALGPRDGDAGHVGGQRDVLRGGGGRGGGLPSLPAHARPALEAVEHCSRRPEPEVQLCLALVPPRGDPGRARGPRQPSVWDTDVRVSSNFSHHLESHLSCSGRSQAEKLFPVVS